MLNWAEPSFADAALAYWATLVATPEPVTDAIRELTGAPARPFAQWARDHAADFRPLPVEEVSTSLQFVDSRTSRLHFGNRYCRVSD